MYEVPCSIRSDNRGFERLFKLAYGSEIIAFKATINLWFEVFAFDFAEKELLRASPSIARTGTLSSGMSSEAIP